MSTLGISLSGLNAAQASIRTTQHNISNINTAGFRRQEVDYSAVSTSTPGSVLFYGSGVGVSSVRSLYNQFEDSQVLLNQGRLSSSEAYSTQASKVDTLIGDANSGLTSAMDSFFGAAPAIQPQARRGKSCCRPAPTSHLASIRSPPRSIILVPMLIARSP